MTPPDTKPRFLIISDSPAFIEMVRSIVGSDKEEVLHTPDWPGMEKHINPDVWQLLIVDQPKYDQNWQDWVGLVKPDENKLVAIMFASSGEAEQAVIATQFGFWDYLMKPVDPVKNREVIEDACLVLEQSGEIENQPESKSRYKGEERRKRVRLLGQSAAMQEIYKQIGIAAPRDVDVLVTGESGTGKEVVCRAIHHYSKRRDGPFIAINCAAVPESLLESELFGHEKGAFTGADARRIGRFEQARGGTILLDEIGDMSPNLQAKLLRLIQDRSFYRVGGSELIHCDTRVLTATHRNLEERIREGLFRQDLFYRLNAVSIHLPPLRERDVDVILIAHAIVATLNRDLGRQINSFHPLTVRALLNYDWPGNVRELQNVMKQSMLAAHGTVLLPAFLPEPLRLLTKSGYSRIHRKSRSTPGYSAGSDLSGEALQTEDSALPEDSAVNKAGNPYGDIAQRILLEKNEDALQVAVAGMERELIRLAMQEHRGNISAAARHLGITRLTLRKKINAYGITFTSSAE